MDRTYSMRVMESWLEERPPPGEARRQAKDIDFSSFAFSYVALGNGVDIVWSVTYIKVCHEQYVFPKVYNFICTYLLLEGC